MIPFILYTKFFCRPSHAIDGIEIFGSPCDWQHPSSLQKEIEAMTVASRDNSPCAELISAIRLHDIDKVRALAPVAATGESNGQTPLVAAVRERRVDLAKAILPHCDPRHANAHGHTALMFAALQDTRCMVDLLLPVSDADAVNTRGETALMFAAEFGYITCIEALLGASNPDIQNKKGLTALMKAIAPYTLARHSWWARLNIVEMLAPRSNLNLQDEDGWTALIHSAQVPAWDVFDLLAKSTDMELKTSFGDTALDLVYQYDDEIGARVEGGGMAND